MASFSQTADRPGTGPVVRYLGAGILAVAGVIAAGVWLGPRLDPTWARRGAPLRRALPFPLPALEPAAAWSRDVTGRPWILELRFPGCGDDDADVTARVAAATRGVRARTGRQPGWVTLLVGGLPGSTSRSPAAGAPARHVAPLDPRLLADVAAGLGLADSVRAAADGLLDARHWMFAVDAAGWVRGAADVTHDEGWPALDEALGAAARAPLPARPSDPPGSPNLIAPARLADFRAVDQDGRPVTAADFAGHPSVVDFIFTHCRGACPTLTARLAALRRIVADPDVRFVSFSVDPANDTPEVLRAYAARWGAPDSRWRLLAADAGTVRAVARSLGESVVAGDGGPLLHSDHFTSLDRWGAVRSRVGSGDAAALRTLASELSAPTLVATPRGEDVGDGARLFSSLGCRGCHDDAALAPALGGVAGRAVRLAGGRTVAADDRYLRQAITAPVADVVDGFRPAMPSYGALLSDAELTALVEFLKTLPR